MKEQVLKQMVAAVDGMKSYKTDFYKYDLPTVARADESTPFMWAVGSCSTALLLLDAQEMEKQADKDEYYRFRFMQDPKGRLDMFKAQANGCKVFWYDGSYFEEIVPEKLGKYLRNTFAPIIQHVKKYITARYGDTDGDYTEQITVKFSSGAERLMRQIMATDEAEALCAVLGRFKSWPRMAKDDYVCIGLDFVEKSFTFSRIANGSCRLNGGIIYDGGKWTMHT